MITCHNVFNVWPKTTLLLPVWPRDAKRLDTPELKDWPLVTDSTSSPPWGSAVGFKALALLSQVVPLAISPHL